jgi:hypothetical protein
MLAGEGMADQDRIRPGGVELAIGFIDQVEGRQHRSALEGQRFGKVRVLGNDGTDTHG